MCETFGRGKPFAGRASPDQSAKRCERGRTDRESSHIVGRKTSEAFGGGPKLNKAIRSTP